MSSGKETWPSLAGTLTISCAASRKRGQGDHRRQGTMCITPPRQLVHELLEQIEAVLRAGLASG